MAIQSTTDFASYFPLFYQSQPLRPCPFHKHNPYIRELRPLSASKPCKTLAMPSILTEPPPRTSGIAMAQNGECHIPSSTTPRRLETKRNKNLFRLQNSRRRGGLPKQNPNRSGSGIGTITGTTKKNANRKGVQEARMGHTI